MRTITTDISDLAVIATPLVLLDCIEQAIIVLTNDRRIRYANQAAVEMLGSQDARAGPDRLDATSFVSSTDLDAAIAELNQTSAAAVRIRVASGTGRFEMSHRSSIDGRRRRIRRQLPQPRTRGGPRRHPGVASTTR